MKHGKIFSGGENIMGFKSHLNSPQLIELLLVEVDTRRIELSSIIPKISRSQSILREYNREYQRVYPFGSSSLIILSFLIP